MYSIQWIQGTLCFSGQARVAQKSWMQKVYSIYSENFQEKLCFLEQAQSCSEILNGRKYIEYSEKFLGKRKLLKNPERWKNFQYTVYIQLVVLRVILANCLFLGQIIIFRANFFRSPQ